MLTIAPKDVPNAGVVPSTEDSSAVIVSVETASVEGTRPRQNSAPEALQTLSPSKIPVCEQISVGGGHFLASSDAADWKLQSETFEAGRVDLEGPRVAALSRKTRKFYERQNAMIDTFVGMSKMSEAKQDDNEEEEEESNHVEFAITVSFVANVFLLVIKLVATIMSGSMSVLASFIDSLLDLVAGGILYWTALSIAKKNTFKYPQGKSRLEPIGTVLFASVMGLASLQIMAECGKRISTGITDEPAEIDMGVVPCAILGVTIVVKAVLAWYCNWVSEEFSSVSVEAYAQDHFNDVLANSVASIGSILAYNVPRLWWADPTAAALLALYIIINWMETGKEQVDLLAGRAAAPEFLRKITYLVYNHDEEILKVDTVRAYHFGVNFLVEVDIVLPEDMPLKKTHDIGESLQMKLEELEDVERAFVHIDWEWEHSPEHKIPQ